jgi:hypothetical protein
MSEMDRGTFRTAIGEIPKFDTDVPDYCTPCCNALNEGSAEKARTWFAAWEANRSQCRDEATTIALTAMRDNFPAIALKAIRSVKGAVHWRRLLTDVLEPGRSNFGSGVCEFRFLQRELKSSKYIDTIKTRCSDTYIAAEKQSFADIAIANAMLTASRNNNCVAMRACIRLGPQPPEYLERPEAATPYAVDSADMLWLLAHHRAIFEDHIVAALTLVRQAVDAGQCPAIPRAMADLISQPK